MSDNTVKRIMLPPTKPILVVPSKKSLPPLPKIGSNRSLKLVAKSEEITDSKELFCPYYETNKHEFIWQSVNDFNKGICICGYNVTE